MPISVVIYCLFLVIHWPPASAVTSSFVLPLSHTVPCIPNRGRFSANIHTMPPYPCQLLLLGAAAFVRLICCLSQMFPPGTARVGTSRRRFPNQSPPLPPPSPPQPNAPALFVSEWGGKLSGLVTDCIRCWGERARESYRDTERVWERSYETEEEQEGASVCVVEKGGIREGGGS